MNRLRLKFSKNGPIKFIGHLDVMRYFQKAIRRAEIDIKYSEGFSPHQVISFAQPLSVGATSDGEYMDMTVNSMKSVSDVMNRLNAVMNEGIEILAIKELGEREEKAMTAAYAAKYRIRFRNSLKPDFDWINEFEAYLKKDKLSAMKKTKSGEKEIDMKPLIFEYNIDKEDESVDLLLSMSSAATLKPALLFGAFFNSLNKELSTNALDVHRIDIYRYMEDGETKYIEPFITDDINTRFILNG
ncbi:MAG: TIGR03936 family radical SAM-associated protein [Butyrivibrio sp.]|nr:TIGR03936 family radical SAM-associated protein [Butyrivibrio sp.]